MSPRLRLLLRQLGHFLMGSGLGLAVDLGLFYLAVRLGAPPWLANVISAGCAVVVVYLFVTKYAFAGGRTRTSFLLFVAWYVTSIAIFSVLIDVLHAQTGWAPFVCKLVSLPPSFAANFAASKLLFGRAGRSADVAPGPAPARDGAGA
ncbi:GtrA family protein [Blastococcus sp. MG754426]|uniref:GtrA family protein n=1 Tax=unclassified Blastococcus TaxID=2619396 RepID=UPI001EEF9769|nr:MULTISPECIES: GtrA family protein [unclassified Blastococcus]MCF6509410.1 GtrA family protein [Blastococcus sp. MG754426]MCF6513903.1 GtrA family protein [Blastococcus sp. MG754427]MCF6736809.1 GtrA family protein [Blastococcus sp. KM273129]